MPEWRTYELSDFLMFAPDTYWRLVARYNADAWPLHLLGLVAALVLFGVATWRPQESSRKIGIVLALAWLHVAWAFHWEHYAQINWAARYFAGACAIEAALLVASAFMPPPAGRAPAPVLRTTGWVLATAGLLYPLATLVAGRPWGQAEVYGLMPEPTALLTLGVLLATGGTRRGLLAVIPLLSLLVGWTTLWLFTAQ